MDAELIAALERAARLCDIEGMLYENLDEGEQGRRERDAALIRAHIETLRNGGERAKIVAWLRSQERPDTNWPQHLALRIERGEHLNAATPSPAPAVEPHTPR